MVRLKPKNSHLKLVAKDGSSTSNNIMRKFQQCGAGILLVLLASGCAKSRSGLRDVAHVAGAPSGQKYSFLVSDGGAASVSQKVLEAMNRGDVKLLLDYAHPEEVRQLHLDLKMLKAYEELYLKEKEGFESRGMTECRENPKGGLCNELLTHDTNEVLIGCAVFSTQKGPKAYITPTLVSAIAQLKAENMTDVASLPRSGPNSFMALLYRELRAKVEPAGVKGLVFNISQNGDLQEQSWDNLIRAASRTRRPISSSMKIGN